MQSQVAEIRTLPSDCVLSQSACSIETGCPTKWDSVVEHETSITRVTSIQARPLWFRESLRTVARLEGIGDNGDTYGAEAPDQIAIEFARLVLTILSEYEFLEPASITAAAEGGICISFSSAGGEYADIECFNTGEILTAIANEGGEPKIWDVEPSIDAILNALESLYLQIG